MSQDRPEQQWSPTPEELAAYADGEADGALRQQVEAWLLEHPEGRAEVERYSELDRIWQGTAPAEPSDAAWGRTLRGIEARLPRTGPSLKRRLRWLTMLGPFLAAACLWGALLLRPVPLGDGGPGSGEDDEPFPVVHASEVVIIGMNPADGSALVVGEPLELPEVNLASHNDIEIMRPGPAEIKLDDWSTPMIVDPQAVASNR